MAIQHKVMHTGYIAGAARARAMAGLAPREFVHCAFR